MSIEVIKQALEALEMYLKLDTMDEAHILEVEIAPKAITALRAAIEQAQEPVCDKDPQGCWSVRCQLGKICKHTTPRQWQGLTDEETYRDGDKGADPKFTKYNMEVAYLAGSTTYKELLNKSEARLHEVAVHCERVERRLKEVNTAAMNLTHDLVCMDYDDDDRLNRDRVMERIMQWRNEWDKAMFKERNT